MTTEPQLGFQVEQTQRIPQMIEKWREGYEDVPGRHTDRTSDSWAKRASANWFYRTHNKIADPVIRLPFISSMMTNCGMR